eukprot:9247286-Alexandrium_andersonii.AAC.1
MQALLIRQPRRAVFERGLKLRQRLRPLMAKPGNACGEAPLAAVARARVRLRKPVPQYKSCRLHACAQQRAESQLRA